MRARLTPTFLAAALLGLALLLAPSPAVAADDAPLVLAPAADQCAGSLAQQTKPDDPQNIQNGPCSLVCSSTISCSFACIDDNEQQSDCGDYGLCDPCKEGIVEINRVEIGRSARTFGPYCEHVIHEEVTWKSVNAGCTAFTTCEKNTVGWGLYIDCCQAWGCYGQTCP